MEIKEDTFLLEVTLGNISLPKFKQALLEETYSA
jgi:hypothetical protein